MAGWWHEHQVRERAFALWEQDGRPAGKEHEHWLQAEAEIAAEEQAAKEAEAIKLDE